MSISRHVRSWAEHCPALWDLGRSLPWATPDTGSHTRCCSEHMRHSRCRKVFPDGFLCSCSEAAPRPAPAGGRVSPLRGCNGQKSWAPPGPIPERSHLYQQQKLQKALARALSQPAPSHPGAISEEGTCWPSQPGFQDVPVGNGFPGSRPSLNRSCHVPPRSRPTNPDSAENTPLKSWLVLDTEP